MLLRKRVVGSILVCVLVLLVVFGAHARLNPFVWLAGQTMAPKRPVQSGTPLTTHIVLFKFKEGTTPFQIKDITSRMLSLERKCIHPSMRTPYIQSISGGVDNSIEKLQDGITHAFIVQFRSNEDRDYYVNDDPVHQDFKHAAGEYLDKAVVVDFHDGIYT